MRRAAGTGGHLGTFFFRFVPLFFFAFFYRGGHVSGHHELVGDGLMLCDDDGPPLNAVISLGLSLRVLQLLVENCDFVIDNLKSFDA